MEGPLKYGMVFLVLQRQLISIKTLLEELRRMHAVLHSSHLKFFWEVCMNSSGKV